MTTPTDKALPTNVPMPEPIELYPRERWAAYQLKAYANARVLEAVKELSQKLLRASFVIGEMQGEINHLISYSGGTDGYDRYVKEVDSINESLAPYEGKI